MSASSDSPPVVLAVSLPTQDRPRLEICPAPGEFDQFCRDLELLRRNGANSNTEAIISAVREEAQRLEKGEDCARAVS